MANPSTASGLDGCVRQLASRPEGKRFRSEDDIRIQLIHDLEGHIAKQDRTLSSDELSKDERSFEEGWRDGLKSMADCFREAEPVLSRSTGLFRPQPLTTDAYHRQLIALVHSAKNYAGEALGNPKQNAVQGSYVMTHPYVRLRPGTYYINAMNEGHTGIWTTVVFHEDGGHNRSGSWDSPKQFLRYIEADPQLINFMKTGYVHDSHEYQYRQGWLAGSSEMNTLANQKRQGLPLYSAE